ncbi:MAG: nucleotide sugar dehydrogenase [Rhodospirillales bacterium]|jgi:UDP-N-acetyl-D-glucosamine dehydrogenase
MPNSEAQNATTDKLSALFRSNKAAIGVIGLGYVGLPLVRAFAAKHFKTTGFDTDQQKIKMLNAGQSYIQYLPAEEINAMNTAGNFTATGDFNELASMDAILICVPTPLTADREPDLSFVEATTKTIARTLRPGQLIILESTTYPGTTADVVRPILEQTGLKCGQDFYLAYSPEREDPGNQNHQTVSIPKLVGGMDDNALSFACALYSQVIEQVVPVASPEVAEAAKLTENIFRSVNIALVNELKAVYAKMGIDIWEVIEAAKTKPFGYMPFYPGPGLGGHCIPIDPFYLSWKAKEAGHPTRFIELAGEINSTMPTYVMHVLTTALQERFQKELPGSRILLIGIAYKKNVDDVRETPAFPLIELLEADGAAVDFYDPYIATIPKTREHDALSGRQSIAWQPEAFGQYDAALICTDHDCINYEELFTHSSLIIDTRNATKSIENRYDKVVLA